MQTAWRRRSTWAIVASIIAHLGVLTAVLLQHPTLPSPVEAGGPPEPIIPLLILPRTPAPRAGHGLQPAPIQLHRRPQRNLQGEAPAPVVIPTPKPAEAPPPASAPAAAKPQGPAPAPPDAVRSVLRATLGCTDSRMVGLTREERAGCLDRLGRGAHEAPYLAPALSPEKRALLDQAGSDKMAQKLAAERPMEPPSRKAPPSDYSGEPDYPSNAIDPPSFPPSKRAAPKLNRLPP